MWKTLKSMNRLRRWNVYQITPHLNLKPKKGRNEREKIRILVKIDERTLNLVSSSSTMID